MKYADNRDTIRSGDLLAWTHRSWKTFYDLQVQAVRFFTQSEYCHVGVAWVIGNRVFVIESVTPTIRIVPLSNLLPFYHLPVKADWTPDVESYALSLVGNGKYSKIEAIKAGLGHELDEHDSKWECAEFAISVLKRAGIDLGKVATPSAVVLAAQRLNSPLYLME
jgi:hypothetical protein